VEKGDLRIGRSLLPSEPSKVTIIMLQ